MQINCKRFITCLWAVSRKIRNKDVAIEKPIAISLRPFITIRSVLGKSYTRITRNDFEGHTNHDWL